MNMPIKLSAALTLAVLSAQVQAVEFSFLGSVATPKIFGNTYTAKADTLTLTASAWSTTGIRGRFQTAELEIYPDYGMGVCNLFLSAREAKKQENVGVGPALRLEPGHQRHRRRASQCLAATR